MEKSCKYFEEVLVDYADGQLSPADSSELDEHVAKCNCCRTLIDGLQKSLDLAGVIWTDGLAATRELHIPAPRKVRRLHWLRHAAVAASILVVVSVSALWCTLTKPKEAEPTVADIEREIMESGNAARLLAASKMLTEHPGTQPLVNQQYRYITERYPETTAANEAKLKIQ